MSHLRVELGKRSYPIHIEQHALNQLPLFLDTVKQKRLVILSNETVAPLYIEQLKSTLQDCDIEQIIIPDGEQYKTLHQYEDILAQMLALKFSRDTVLLALGGGVIGDIGGFAAATYQRGIPLIQIPTTLLSQVDSSVGGKTAVNHALGKNMIGAFYQPKAVIIDIETLKTLPPREFSAGMAEVIKYGIIADFEFFVWLEKNSHRLKNLEIEALEYAIRRCCQIKADIVSKDETEKGMRALLNLGHTFGHAIEAHMGYGNWLHGEAVSAGMVIASQVAEHCNWMTASEIRRIVELLHEFKLPVKGPNNMSYDDYVLHMQHDKKVSQGRINFIMPKHIGEAFVTNEIPQEVLRTVLG